MVEIKITKKNKNNLNEKYNKFKSVVMNISDSIKGESDPVISAKKFGFYSIVLFILNLILNLIQSSQEPILDMTLRSAITASILALINFLKHRGG